MIEGRWQARGEAWAFRLETVEASALFLSGQLWRVYDGYWGDRVVLVLSKRIWERTVFEPSDAVRVDQATAAGMGFEGGVLLGRAAPDGPEGQRVPGGWNHEHCDICTQKIGVSGQAIGYRSDAGEWVCEACYRNYVEPKSLGFIPHT
jgi:hypothetical protein